MANSTTEKKKAKGATHPHSSRFFNRQEFIPKKLADYLLDEYHFFSVTGRVYVYLDGVYQATGDEFIRKKATELLGEDFRRGRVEEVLAYIRNVSAIQPGEININKRLLNLENGLFDLDDMELRPHTPDVLSTIRIHAPYDPNATCPTIDRFLSEILTEDCIPVIEEMFGYALIPETRFEKAFMFNGTGANGKGKLIDLLTALIGKENTSNASLQDLMENRFKKAELYGKLLNAFADLPNKLLLDTSVFKMIVSGDRIQAERKFGQPFEFSPFAKLVFSANEIPSSSENSFAFFRRWLVIPFPNQFNDGMRDVHLIDKMTTPSELSGLLNRAIRGLKRLDEQNQFSESETMKKAMEDYYSRSDTVKGFIDDRCLVESEYFVLKTDLYQMYQQWCLEMGLKIVTQRKFNERLQVILPTVVERRNELKQRIWKGIGVEAS